MKAGKLSESILKRSVLKQLHRRRSEVTAQAGVGFDYGAFVAPEVVIATNPATRAFGRIADSGICRAVNNVACSGAEPVAVEISLLVPTNMNEPQLRELMKEIDEAAKKVQVQIIGGHTEVTRQVKEPLLTVTALGKIENGKKIMNSGVRPGMDLVVTKWIALEGTAILARMKQDELCQRYAKPFIEKAKEFSDYHSILPEAKIATGCNVAAMHDVSEGGIFGALWEMAQASHVGLEIDLKKIPIRQETIEICEFFDLNPYKLISGGSLLIAAENGNSLIHELEKEKIPAVLIGKATEGNDRILINDEERRFLETTQTDELYKIFP